MWEEKDNNNQKRPHSSSAAQCSKRVVNIVSSRFRQQGHFRTNIGVGLSITPQSSAERIYTSRFPSHPGEGRFIWGRRMKSWSEPTGRWEASATAASRRLFWTDEGHQRPTTAGSASSGEQRLMAGEHEIDFFLRAAAKKPTWHLIFRCTCLDMTHGSARRCGGHESLSSKFWNVLRFSSHR